MSLGTHLRELRKHHKIGKPPTLDDVADAIEISTAGLQMIETDSVKKPEVTTLISLADYYGVPLKSLTDLIEK